MSITVSSVTNSESPSSTRPCRLAHAFSVGLKSNTFFFFFCGSFTRSLHVLLVTIAVLHQPSFLLADNVSH